MRDPGLPSLDQLRVFIAVIDHGGFAHAARALHRTQSVISYTIANLEEQLNVALLDRGKRKPVLTEAGKALLADARAVSLKVDSMRSRAKALSAGLEAEVSLVVDVMFSTCTLVRILHAFQKEFPTVSMRLRMEALGAVTELVMERVCHIGVSGWMPGTPDTIERQSCGFVTMVPVVSPLHPLAAIEGKVPSALLREHTQLVVTDRSKLTEGQDFGVLALRDWRLGDLGSKYALLRSGIGWGNMPWEMVRDDLAAGRLVQLDIAEGSSFSFPLYVIHRGDEEPGPAGKWLMRQFLDLDQPGVAVPLPAAPSLSLSSLVPGHDAPAAPATQAGPAPGDARHTYERLTDRKPLAPVDPTLAAAHPHAHTHGNPVAGMHGIPEPGAARGAYQPRGTPAAIAPGAPISLLRR